MKQPTPQILAKPVLEKNRKVGNQIISPVGGSARMDVMPRDYGQSPNQSLSSVNTGIASPVVSDSNAKQDPYQTPPFDGRGNAGEPVYTTQPYYGEPDKIPAGMNTPPYNPNEPDKTNHPGIPNNPGEPPTRNYPEKVPEIPAEGLGRNLLPVETQPVGSVPELDQQPLERTLSSGGLASPTAQRVNDNDLVRNQITGLLEENSKYLQLARTGAAQTAARRGLTNSSIAAGAGENAAIRNALPIAQQDAGTYFAANTNTVNSANQFARDRANAGYTQDNMLLQSDINEQTQERDQNNALARAEQSQGYNLQRDSINAGYTQDNMLLQGDINEQTQQRDHANNLATLDRQGFIQTRRDELLQGFESLNIDQNHRNNLEQIAANFINTQEENRFQMGAQYQSQYLQASSNLQNSWSAEIQSIYQNSEMTPQQQSAAVREATARFQNQAEVLTAMYTELGGWNVVTEQFPLSPEQIQAQQSPATPPGTPPANNPYIGSGGDGSGYTYGGGSGSGSQNPYSPGTIDYEEWESNNP